MAVKLPSLQKSASATGGGTTGTTSTSTGPVKAASQTELRQAADLDKNRFVARFTPGEHGLTFSNLQVTGSILQGWMRGVRCGWTVVAVAKKVVQTDEELEESLAQAAAGECRYELVFEKGQGSFGTEAKERADKEKRNRTRLRKMFRFFGAIEKTEQRGLTYEQMGRVIDYASRYVNEWYDKAPAKFSRNSGKPLDLATLNLYHINDWVILPATKPKKCSMVEMLASKPQTATWFVSHWWGEPVTAFAQCMRAHLAVRRLSPETTYWICAYANRQHLLQQEITADPRDSSFFKAMEAAKFHVLLVLDPSATPFTRIWCAFEETACLDRPITPLDVATYVPGASRAEVLTYGLTDYEVQMEQVKPRAGSTAKASRESTFPVQVTNLGLTAELQHACASVERDRVRILNSLVGAKNLDDVPPVEHSRFDEINTRLHALFAASLWMRLTVGAGTAGEHAEGARLCAEALKADTTRKSLDMDLEGASSAQFALLAQHFPPNLERLMLNLHGASIKDDDVKVIAKSLPRSLSSLNMNLSNCSNVGDDGLKALSVAVKKSTSNVDVDVKLVGTKASKEIKDWYAEQALKKASADTREDDTKQKVATVLGCTLMRRPEESVHLRKRIEPVIPLLARALEDEEDPAKAQMAFSALEGFGEKAFQALDGAAAQRAQEMRQVKEQAAREREAREREKAKEEAVPDVEIGEEEVVMLTDAASVKSDFHSGKTSLVECRGQIASAKAVDFVDLEARAAIAQDPYGWEFMEDGATDTAEANEKKRIWQEEHGAPWVKQTLRQLQQARCESLVPFLGICHSDQIGLSLLLSQNVDKRGAQSLWDYVTEQRPDGGGSEASPAWLSEPPSPFCSRKKLGWLLDLAKALDYLHTRYGAAMVHGDVRPEQVILTAGGDRLMLTSVPVVEPTLRVTISDLQTKGLSDIAHVPPEGILDKERMNPLDYWRANANARTVPRDIYAFGCVMYFVLTGHRVFACFDNEGDALTDEVAERFARGEIPHPLDLDGYFSSKKKFKRESYLSSLSDMEALQLLLGSLVEMPLGRMFGELFDPEPDKRPSASFIVKKLSEEIEAA